ncbi:MAG: hypothetical protein HKN57_04085 [Xanthomonadales bacterium]|nr:hypothetical protein [Gammaproteobacteria bacterium]NND56410.1 hypothetical protein [Xanthomonadales bacterium]NNK51796.1 hypothetical protein [Xanthomonadales bacterium]
MLKAENKNDVIKWGTRQLGTQSRLISVSETEFSRDSELVEKGGTGIKAREASGCQPIMSIMANFRKTATDDIENYLDCDLDGVRPRLKGMMPSIH